MFSHVPVIFLSPVVVLAPNDSFGAVSVLHSVKEVFSIIIKSCNVDSFLVVNVLNLYIEIVGVLVMYCRLGLETKCQWSGGIDCDFYILAIRASERLIVRDKCYVVVLDVLCFGFRK